MYSRWLGTCRSAGSARTKLEVGESKVLSTILSMDAKLQVINVSSRLICVGMGFELVHGECI